MDPATRSAVRSFQERSGLVVDGIVGPPTERALIDAARAPSTPAEPMADSAQPSEPSNQSTAPPEPTAAASDTTPADQEWEGEVNRSSREYIRWVQSSLNKLLGLALAVDGIKGPMTTSAVRSFQQRNGLIVDGLVGPQTEAALVAAGAGSPPQIGETPGSGTTPASATINTALPASGPGFYSYTSADKRFGLPETIGALQAIASAWQRAHPDAPRLGIGDISFRGGGLMPKHASHQKGLDIDIRPVRGDGREQSVTYHDATYSRALTQDLVNRIIANGILRVQYIFFNDPAITSVRWSSGHDNHLHVRFYPPTPASSYASSAKELMWLNTELDGEWEGEINRSSRDYVRWVQQSLNKLLGLNLAVDGISGAQTRSAIRSFQSRQGLAADGVVGPQTERALIAAGSGQPPGTGASAGPSAPASTPSPAGTPYTISQLRNNIVRIALEEWERWGRGTRKESDSRMRAILDDYWFTGTGIRWSEPEWWSKYPWSAAFISWVMRRAGAGSAFAYSAGHADYISAAKANRLAGNSNPFKAYRLTEAQPRIGDLVCKSRAGSNATYDSIRPGLATHCDIVTDVRPGRLTTIGGNLSDSVSTTSVSTDAKGYVNQSGYFAVIKVG